MEILFLLIIFLISQIKCYYVDEKLKLNYTFSFIYDSLKSNAIGEQESPISEKIILENIKFLNDKEIFANFPIGNKNVSSTFTKYNFESQQFEPWPNNTNFTGFNSVISFEFGQKNSIYILDNKEKNISLYKFDLQGNLLQNYILNYSNLTLIDFLLDENNLYSYISYYKESNNETGFLILDLEKVEYHKVILKDNELKFDETYILLNRFYKNIKEIDNIKKCLISMTLTCDGEVLIFSPLSSRKIFSVLTKKLQNTETNSITKDDISEAYKNDATSAMILSDLGNLYLTGIENDITYIAGQIDYDLSIFNYKGIEAITMENDIQDRNKPIPVKISIGNENLYVIYKSINGTKKDTYTIKNYIFKSKLGKEKSYVNKCVGITYKWSLISIVFWGIFIIIVIFVLIFVLVGNEQDKDINKKNE